MKTSKQEIEFLRESNAIEGEYSNEAMKGAINAWTYANKKRFKNPTVGYIEKIHKELMTPLKPEIAGKIRSCGVTIGGKLKKKTSPYIISEQLREWLEKYWNVEKEELIKEAHVAFEEIHPFVDGNGRTGRILFNVMRFNTGYPIMIIKESERQDYYNWFKTPEEIANYEIEKDKSLLAFFKDYLGEI